MTLAIRGRGGQNNLEIREDGTANTLLTPNGGRAGIGCGAVAFNATHDVAGTMMSYSKSGGDSNRIDNAAGGYMAVAPSTMQVRCLTPRECERLQGFPDDYTLIPYRNKPAADGPRYKALGNSMAVPVMRWIGEQIANASLV
jgi:DNA (cytosine-5)-methyltransferase 1